MTKHIQPIFTVARSDIPKPARKQPGTKSYEVDEKYIEVAIEGIKSGKYKSANNAAQLIATELAVTKNYESIQTRLRKKISARLKVT